MSTVHSYWNDDGDPAILLNLPNQMKEGYTLPEDVGAWQVLSLIHI